MPTNCSIKFVRQLLESLKFYRGEEHSLVEPREFLSLLMDGLTFKIWMRLNCLAISEGRKYSQTQQEDFVIIILLEPTQTYNNINLGKCSLCLSLSSHPNLTHLDFPTFCLCLKKKGIGLYVRNFQESDIQPMIHQLSLIDSLKS